MVTAVFFVITAVVFFVCNYYRCLYCNCYCCLCCNCYRCLYCNCYRCLCFNCYGSLLRCHCCSCIVLIYTIVDNTFISSLTAVVVAVSVMLFRFVSHLRPFLIRHGIGHTRWFREWYPVWYQFRMLSLLLLLWSKQSLIDGLCALRMRMNDVDGSRAHCPYRFWPDSSSRKLSPLI